MGFIQTVVDAVTKKPKFVPYPGFVNDVNETVDVAPKATFTLTVDIDDDHFLEAFVDGGLHQDGIHFNRNSIDNTITFTENISIGAFVQVKIYYK